MPAKSRQICDAIVTSLNTQTWTPAVTAERNLLALVERENIDAVKLEVVPADQKYERLTRGGTYQRDHAIVIVVRAPVTNDELALEQYEDLVDSIIDYLLPLPISNCVPIEVEQDEPFSLEALMTEGIFESITLVRYRRAA